ncbi:suppressor protein SRP40-like [Sitophilus oryzae]|uniref:Suppressor protein SRP40-like n=1 Tax=Sitophilus oryzae TaxID=7048 RepID=A0A6J2YRP7_SITOR|nr:suppressor protein SRP40-like [Sitophilus oryzae]
MCLSNLILTSSVLILSLLEQWVTLYLAKIINIKYFPPQPKVKLSPNFQKTEESPVKAKKEADTKLLVKIDLSRLNIDEIPILKRYIETKKHSVLDQKEHKCKTEPSDEEKARESSVESRKTVAVQACASDAKSADSKKAKKRKRKNSGSSVSSVSAVSNNPSYASKKEKDKEPYKEKSRHKSKRKKDDASLTKQQQLQGQSENLNSINTPPTNHERDCIPPAADTSAYSPSKKKSKAARGSDEFKNAKHDSDDEWNERKRSRVKALFQDSRSDRSESESSVRRRRDKPKESTSPFRRKHAKSVAFVQTSDSSDSDEPPPRVGRPSRSSTSENHVHHISDSDSDLDSVPKKLDKVDEHKSIADKNKNNVLSKLFTPKRDTEGGGKGGGKGGKGGKGKGGVNVIIVDGNDERTSSSVEDEAMPTISNTNLLSPIPTNDNKISSVQPKVKLSPNFQKTEESPVKAKKEADTKLLVKIDLSRLNIDEIPILKRYIETKKHSVLDQKSTNARRSLAMRRRRARAALKVGKRLPFRPVHPMQSRPILKSEKRKGRTAAAQSRRCRRSAIIHLMPVKRER